MPYVRRPKRRLSSRRRKSYSKIPRGVYKTRPRRSYVSARRFVRNKWTNPVPPNGYFKFRYVDNGFDGSTTAVASYRAVRCFRGDSLFDPDLTGVGVQPYGYDQLCPDIFGQYRVVSSAITISWAITSATCSQLKVFVVPTTSANPTNEDVSDLRVVPFCRYTTCDKATGLGRRQWLKAYASGSKITKIFNWNYVEAAAAYNANPSTCWYWQVYFDTSDAAEEVDIVYDVKIAYYSILTRTQTNLDES